MELKLQKDKALHATDRLLIVPYGIETWKDEQANQIQDLLLIVPYGIETSLRS